MGNIIVIMLAMCTAMTYIFIDAIVDHYSFTGDVSILPSLVIFGFFFIAQLYVYGNIAYIVYKHRTTNE